MNSDRFGRSLASWSRHNPASMELRSIVVASRASGPFVVSVPLWLTRCDPREKGSALGYRIESCSVTRMTCGVVWGAAEKGSVAFDCGLGFVRLITFPSLCTTSMKQANLGTVICWSDVRPLSFPGTLHPGVQSVCGSILRRQWLNANTWRDSALGDLNPGTETDLIGMQVVELHSSREPGCLAMCLGRTFSTAIVI